MAVPINSKFKKQVSQEAMAIDYRACLAEFLAMTLFVFVGTGSAAMNMSVDVNANGTTSPDPAWVLGVALSFGTAIMVRGDVFWFKLCNNAY
jgi:glycerol uptake facilitator-like aquaporin